MRSASRNVNDRSPLVGPASGEDRRARRRAGSAASIAASASADVEQAQADADAANQRIEQWTAPSTTNIDGSVIQTGTVMADRIGGGTLTNVIDLGDGALQKIGTGGKFLLDGTGLRLWDNPSGSGDPTVVLDADDGAATFRGTVEGAVFRTAPSGERIVIDGAAPDDIAFYTGQAGELNRGVVGVSGGSTWGSLDLYAPQFHASRQALLRLYAHASDGSGYAKLEGDKLYLEASGSWVSMRNANGAQVEMNGDALTIASGPSSQVTVLGPLEATGDLSSFGDVHVGSASEFGWTGTSERITRGSSLIDLVTAGVARFRADSGGAKLMFGNLRMDAGAKLILDDNAGSNTYIDTLDGGATIHLVTDGGPRMMLRWDRAWLAQPLNMKPTDSADANYSVRHSPTHDGLVVRGWLTAGLESVGYDVRVDASTQGRCGNRGMTAGKPFTASSFPIWSDERLKKGIAKSEGGGAAAKLRRMGVYRWQYEADDTDGYGFLAQEVEGLFPDAVSVAELNRDGGPVEFKTVKLEGLLAAAIEAVQELTDRVEGLERGK